MSLGLVGTGGGGFRRFIDRVKQIPKERAARRMDAFGRAVVEYARAVVPVDTGKLRDSIGYTFNASTMTVHVHADVPYAVFVEYGTSRMAAQPYIRPAVEHSRHLLHSSDTVEAQFMNAPGKYAGGMAGEMGGTTRYQG